MYAIFVACATVYLISKSIYFAIIMSNIASTGSFSDFNGSKSALIASGFQASKFGVILIVNSFAKLANNFDYKADFDVLDTAANRIISG